MSFCGLAWKEKVVKVVEKHTDQRVRRRVDGVRPCVVYGLADCSRLLQLNLFPWAWGEYLIIMGECVTVSLLVTCVLPCLRGDWVSFCVPGATGADGAWVWVKSGLRCALLLKVYVTLGNGDRVWEQSSCWAKGRRNDYWVGVGNGCL